MSHWIYHERQESSLCGQHCLNNLLQGPYFSADMLADIAHELDQMEQQYMLEAGTETEHALRFLAEDSGNVDDSGNFSIQVLRTAVERSHNIGLVSWTANEMREAVEDPTTADGFICNRAEHWFAIRKIGNKFWNLNSVEDKPTPIGDFYLSAFLAQLRADGYSVFIVTGTLPPSPRAPIEGGTGRWYTEDQLLRGTSTGSTRQERNPFGGAGRRLGGRTQDSEEEQLLLAQALSMAEADRQESDMDPDLAMALALSMADQTSAAEATRVDLPAEPDPADPEAITLQLRLPSGERLMRRFSKHDRTVVLRAFVEQQLQPAGQAFECIAAGKRVSFDDVNITFAESGFESNTSVTVRLL